MKGLKNFREVVTVGDAEADINPLVTAVSPIHKLPVRPSYSANSTYQLMHFSIQYFYAITRFHKMQGLVKWIIMSFEWRSCPLFWCAPEDNSVQ